MFEEIDRAAAALSDAKATWITRRDAADLLGDAAGRALAALNLHVQDPDTDVRDAVGKALSRVNDAHETHDKVYSLEDLARACEKPGERKAEKHENGFTIEVRLPNGRHQVVYLSLFARKDGHQIVRIFTYCGKPTPESLRYALEANTKLSRGALGLVGEGNDERLVMVTCHDASTAKPVEIKAAVKEIAYYGDVMEQKLSGLDEL